MRKRFVLAAACLALAANTATWAQQAPQMVISDIAPGMAASRPIMGASASAPTMSVSAPKVISHTTPTMTPPASILVPRLFVGRHSKQDGVLYPDLNIRRGVKDALCWQVRGRVGDGKTRVAVTEYVRSPSTAFFGGSDVIAQYNSDRTQHTLTSLMQPDEAGNLVRCWAFERTDPLGEYTIKVEVEQQPMGETTFQLVP